MEFLGLGTFFVCSEVSNMFDKVTIREHFWNLCAKVGVECMEHLDCAQDATQARDWRVACAEWTNCGEVIVRSGLLDRDDRIWLLGAHALVSANLLAFYRKNYRRALKDAIAASKACDEVQNMPDTLDFKSYVEATLLKVMYLWASTLDCEEEALDADMTAFLIGKLGHPEDSESDSEVRTLKHQCKKFLENKPVIVIVIWELQKEYYNYFETKECLRWARKGSQLYRGRYPRKLDYVSKLNEAFLLYASGDPKEASKVFAHIIRNLDSKPWKARGTDAHPAALFCNPQYVYVTHYFQCLCHRQLAVQSGLGKKEASEMIKIVNQEEATCAALLTKTEYAEMFRVQRDRVREAFERAAKNKWEEGFERCSRDESKWHRFTHSAALNMLHTEFRTEYRKSYENGTPDERYFLNAKLCAMEVLENCVSLGPIDYARILSFMNLVRLYHEKDREVMFFKQSSSFDVEGKAPILQYGEDATECYVQKLLRLTQHDDYWVVAQASCSDLYYMLQFHYFAKWIASHACTPPRTSDIKFTARLQQLWNQSLESGAMTAKSSVSQEIWKQSMVWAERRVGKATYFQLAPNVLTTSAMQQLCEFDRSDDVAWKTLKSSRAACGAETVVLEYFLSEGNDLQFVYVMTKDDVFMQILNVNGLDSILWKILKWLRNMCSLVHSCQGAFINGVLELLHEILISPVANFLDGMEPKDKLIIVAPEILSDVPFAALRKPNSPVGKGYLIERHTISVTPSLRMLQHCNERLKELDQDVLDTKPGTIVAVGDPAYKNRLKATGEEVDFIEELFGERHVKKLKGSEATPSEVLKWAKYPSENCVKQVIFHIAAHGIAQDDKRKVKRGAIMLARPASSRQQNCATAGPGAIAGAEGDENGDDDKVHDETQLADSSLSMAEVKEHMSSHGEVGGLRTGNVVPISESARDILKSENISGCGFQWKAHMVVLSACDTARGQITGEGVLNLPRALMIAGVPCVVVSQWKVDDSPTYKLMKGFYQHLESGKDVSSSLRAAMLQMIKDGDKVCEWAAFIVCGSPIVCLPKKLQGGRFSCNDQDYETSSDRKAEPRGKKVKVNPVDLTEWRMERFFKRDESTTTCLRCNMEYYDDDDDAGKMKKILARLEEIEKMENPTEEEVRELDQLSAQNDSISARQALVRLEEIEKMVNPTEEAVREREQILAWISARQALVRLEEIEKMVNPTEEEEREREQILALISAMLAKGVKGSSLSAKLAKAVKGLSPEGGNLSASRASTSSSIQVEGSHWWQAIRAWGESHPEAIRDWVVSHINWVVFHAEVIQVWGVPHPEAIREAIRDSRMPCPEAILDWAILHWLQTHSGAVLDWFGSQTGESPKWKMAHLEAIVEAMRDWAVAHPRGIHSGEGPHWEEFWFGSHPPGEIPKWEMLHKEAVLEAVRNWGVPNPEAILDGVISDPAIRDWVILEWVVPHSEAIQDRKAIRDRIQDWADSHPEGTPDCADSNPEGIPDCLRELVPHLEGIQDWASSHPEGIPDRIRHWASSHPEGIPDRIRDWAGSHPEGIPDWFRTYCKIRGILDVMGYWCFLVLSKGKKVKENPLDLTDWHMERFLKRDVSTICLRCNMEYYDDGDGAGRLKKILVRLEENEKIINLTDEEVKELDQLLAMKNSISAKLVKGGK